jgi:NlpC/P60 family putative phage cell wall peptidase
MADAALSIAEEAVAIARGWIGTPYRHQASLKGVGCDCLGLIRGVYRELYGAETEPVPPYASDWAEACGTERLADAGRRHLVEITVGEAGIGDIVLFRWRPHHPAKHAGIIASATTFIHAYDGTSVVESPMSAWWTRRRASAYRLPPRG